MTMTRQLLPTWRSNGDISPASRVGQPRDGVAGTPGPGQRCPLQSFGFGDCGCQDAGCLWLCPGVHFCGRRCPKAHGWQCQLGSAVPGSPGGLGGGRSHGRTVPTAPLHPSSPGFPLLPARPSQGLQARQEPASYWVNAGADHGPMEADPQALLLQSMPPGEPAEPQPPACPSSPPP